MAWTGSDCGRAIRERGAQLRASGALRDTTQGAMEADAALWTMAKLLPVTGGVSDSDCRKLEAWLDKAR